jgi:hypothetical protein
VFGKGWGRRVAEVRAAALAMAGGKTAPIGPLAGRIVAAMRAAGYQIDTRPGEINIVYVEGMGPDGTANDNAPNRFNDLRVVLRRVDAGWELAGCWEATTEPSRHWTRSPMNPAGAARIAFGQHQAWRVGFHPSGRSRPHEALVQTGGPVTVHRDGNRDGKRAGDQLDTGWFGINQHWGYDLPAGDLGQSSAGCLVGRTREGHRAFMALVKSDPRRVADPAHVFATTVLPASAVLVTTDKGVPAPVRTKLGFAAALAAALAAAAHWLDAHPLLVAGAVVVAVLAAVYILRTREK